RVVGERAGVREADAMVLDHAGADALRLGGGQLLDLALVRADLGVARPHDDRFDLFALVGPAGDAIADGEEAVELGTTAHAAVPPIVNACTRKVGTPWPTGPP